MAEYVTNKHLSIVHPLEEKITALEQRIDPMCDICTGSKVTMKGEPCICKDGTQEGELHAIRVMLFDAEKSIVKLEEEKQLYRNCLYGCDKHKLWSGMSCIGCIEEERDKLRAENMELREGLRKAILWAESISLRIIDRDDINWTYLNDAGKALSSPSTYHDNHQRMVKALENLRDDVLMPMDVRYKAKEALHNKGE